MFKTKQTQVQTQRNRTPARLVGLSALAFGIVSATLIGSAAPTLVRTGNAPALQPADIATNTAVADRPEPTSLPTKLIQDVRVGDRVMAHNPELNDAERQVPAPDPKKCRHLTLRMLRSDGSQTDIELLRPIEWIEATGAVVGGVIELELPELDAVGPAEVLAIDPCPEIKAGNGAVVTGTFSHVTSGNVLDLHVSGMDEPIGVTDRHPFWSEDQQAFMSARSLHAGDCLRGASGVVVRVLSITPKPGDHRVYNLEVLGEHVYEVSSAGLLVHNGSPRILSAAIGSLPETERAAAMGFERFFTHRSDWESLNYLWMDGVIARGLPVKILPHRPGSFTVTEIEYFIDHGYERWGNWLFPAGMLR